MISALTVIASIFSFAVDFLIDLDVWSDMRFCHVWENTGHNILIAFDVPTGVDLVLRGLLVDNSDLTSTPYTLPGVLMEPIIDDFSVRAKLLSEKIREHIEPVSTAKASRLLYDEPIPNSAQ